MKREILKLLGYQSDTPLDEYTDILIDKALKEVEALSDFKYIYACFDQPCDFLLQNAAYRDYLSGASEYLLCATTLGIAVDRRLKRLQVENMSMAVVFDAVASVYLERLADDFERQLNYPSLGFRFCPGYGGTSIGDNRTIAELLQADRIGISFLDSGLMLPMKSMVGVVKIGSESRKTCDACVAAASCAYRKRGVTCYPLAPSGQDGRCSKERNDRAK